MAIFLTQFGMDGLFLFRIHYADKQKRLADKTMEMVWRGSKSLGESAEIFTGVLFSGYGAPSGFCFDIRCQTAIPIQVCLHIYIYTFTYKLQLCSTLSNAQVLLGR